MITLNFYLEVVADAELLARIKLRLPLDVAADIVGKLQYLAS